MKKYHYETVQMPLNVKVARKDKNNKAGAYLRDIINKKSEENWEFVSVESVGLTIKPGCLGALIGRKSQHLIHSVIVFRREVD